MIYCHKLPFMAYMMQGHKMKLAALKTDDLAPR